MTDHDLEWWQCQGCSIKPVYPLCGEEGGEITKWWEGGGDRGGITYQGKGDTIGDSDFRSQSEQLLDVGIALNILLRYFMQHWQWTWEDIKYWVPTTLICFGIKVDGIYKYPLDWGKSKIQKVWFVFPLHCGSEKIQLSASPTVGLKGV